VSPGAGEPLLLGLDVGSSGTKAVLLEPGSGIVASAQRDTPLHAPGPAYAEADPADWWDATCALVPELLGRAAAGADRIAAVAVAGLVPAVIPLDEAGRPLRRAIMYNDARAVDEIAELAAALPGVDFVRRTGSALTQQSVGPTLRWLARHEPELWARTRTLAGSYEWLARMLGAEPHVERNWALESGLYELDGTLADDIVAAAGARAGLLPPLRFPGDRIGEVSADAASACGLRAGTPIVVGGADHVSSAYAAGLAAPGDWLVKLGSSGDILAVSADAVLDARLYLDAHPAPGRWLPNGCMATSGSLLRWLQALLGGADLAALDAQAAAVGPGAGGLICLPWLLGEKSPLHDPRLRGAFLGLHLGHGPAHLHRACLEAVAYGFRHHVEVLRELGVPLGTARVSNGGSRSTLWKQVLADVLQVPLAPVVDNPGASLGAAVAAGIGVGLVGRWDDIRALVHLGLPIEPGPPHDAYEEGYAMYRSLADTLRPTMHALAGRSRAVEVAP
jgi:xylulokinase